MILIDKTRELQTIILTLTESSSGLTGQYILNLKGDGDRGEYSFTLPVNQSKYTQRFDRFDIETSVFNDLSDGIYTYQVTLNDAVIEMGKAYVKSATEPSDVVIQPNSSTDKILMYGE
jgi:hypothetical protein